MKYIPNTVCKEEMLKEVGMTEAELFSDIPEELKIAAKLPEPLSEIEVLNKMSLEYLMQILVEPPENHSNKLSFLESQKLLETELMLLMEPEDLMQVKVENREKIILEFTVLEPEQGFEKYEECAIKPVGNIWESSCINSF